MPAYRQYETPGAASALARAEPPKDKSKPELVQVSQLK